LLEKHLDPAYRGLKMVKVAEPLGPIRKKVNCYYCGEMFEIGAKLHVHECRIHGKPRNVKPGVLLEDEEEVENWILDECCICNGIFCKKMEFQNFCSKHDILHHKEDWETCAICGDVSTGIDMKEHIRIVHTRVFVVKKKYMGTKVLHWNGVKVSENMVDEMMVKNFVQEK
jgi:hypothetical protein